MTGTAPVTVRTALRQSLEALLADRLQRSASDTGYTLGEIVYGSAVEIALHKGDTRFVVWLRPWNDASASYKQTARFKLGYLDAPPDPGGFALLDAICADMQRWETSHTEEAITQLYDAHALGSLNLELLAVRAGLKPACRCLVSPKGVDELLRNVRDDGLYAEVADAPDYVTRFRWGFIPGETTIVYVARTEQAALTAAKLERAVMSGWRRWLRAIAIERALGQALGYPACCTDAFLKRRKLPNDTIRFHALAQTGKRAAAPLNDVDETRSVISHFVCRYDCAPSLRYAEALLTELGRSNPVASDARRAALRGLVVRFRDGGALRLTVSDSSAARLGLAAVDAFGSGPLLGVWQEALQEGSDLEVGDGYVRILQGDREARRLPAPAQDVALRVFV